MKQHTQVLKKLLVKYTLDKNVLGIYLLGSLSKYTATEKSDIDLEIIFKKRKKEYELFHRKIDGIKVDLSFYTLEKFNDDFSNKPYLMYCSLNSKILYDPKGIIKKNLGIVKKYFDKNKKIKDFWIEKETKYKADKKLNHKTEDFFAVCREIDNKLIIKIEKVKSSKLSKNYISIMHKARRKEYGSKRDMDFKKEDKNGIFFFVKDNNKIVSFGMLKPINVEYLSKRYVILGIGRVMSVIKSKGYGKILIDDMIKYMKSKGKTGLGFTEHKNSIIFKKLGLNTEENFIQRFRYKNQKTGEIKSDNDGDGIYYEGKDKLISKMLKTKGIAYTNADFW